MTYRSSLGNKKQALNDLNICNNLDTGNPFVSRPVDELSGGAPASEGLAERGRRGARNGHRKIAEISQNMTLGPLKMARSAVGSSSATCRSIRGLATAKSRRNIRPRPAGNPQPEAMRRSAATSRVENAELSAPGCHVSAPRACKRRTEQVWPIGWTQEPVNPPTRLRTTAAVPRTPIAIESGLTSSTSGRVTAVMSMAMSRASNRGDFRAPVNRMDAAPSAKSRSASEQPRAWR